MHRLFMYRDKPNEIIIEDLSKLSNNLAIFISTFSVQLFWPIWSAFGKIPKIFLLEIKKSRLHKNVACYCFMKPFSCSNKCNSKHVGILIIKLFGSICVQLSNYGCGWKMYFNENVWLTFPWLQGIYWEFNVVVIDRWKSGVRLCS